MLMVSQTQAPSKVYYKLMNYSATSIIYNPNSTSGHAKQKAERLAAKLTKRDFKNVRLIATEHSGHAEELAYKAARKHRHPLIVSVSGDGGYNEVVNGVMQAKDEDPKRKPVCALLPAGNANDHRRSVRKRPLAWAIIHDQPEDMDLLKLQVKTGNSKRIRYAHSYIGVGITSHAANQLNKESLGPLKEILIVARAVFSFHPVAISETGGKVRRYDSLIFSNIHRMSKFLRIGKRTDINNGSFRVAVIPYRSNWWLARFTLNFLLLVFGLKNLPQQASYSFGVLKSELVHLDGEVTKVPAGSKLRVRVEPAGLAVIR